MGSGRARLGGGSGEEMKRGPQRGVVGGRTGAASMVGSQGQGAMGRLYWQGTRLVVGFRCCRWRCQEPAAGAWRVGSCGRGSGRLAGLRRGGPRPAHLVGRSRSDSDGFGGPVAVSGSVCRVGSWGFWLVASARGRLDRTDAGWPGGVAPLAAGWVAGRSGRVSCAGSWRQRWAARGGSVLPGLLLLMVYRRGRTTGVRCCCYRGVA